MSRFFSAQFFIPSVCLMLLAGPCAECFAQAPTTTHAISESAQALYRGDPRLAAELAEKRLRQYPNDATERVILARAELAQGNFQRAYQDLQTALASDPRNIDALYYLAIVAKALSQQ